MKAPKDLPELWDRGPEERERLWAAAEKASWTKFRSGLLIVVFAILLIVEKHIDVAMPFPAGLFSAPVAQVFSALAFGAIMYATHISFHRLHQKVVRRRLRDFLSGRVPMPAGVKTGPES
jgi:uncharacterized integral membrane protein